MQHRKVSFDPGYQLLSCLDCIESDSLLFTRIEKIFATSQGMFRYKEIVYIVIIFLEHSSQLLPVDEIEEGQALIYKIDQVYT